MGRRIVRRIQRTRSKDSRVQKKSLTPTANSPLMDLQKSIGSKAVQRLINSSYIQTKLQVSSPEDESERDADEAAGAIMRSPEGTNPTTSGAQTAGVGKQTRGASPVPNLESRLASTGSSNALSPDVRSFMEPRLDADLSNVKVHTDHDAAEMSDQLQAQAFTVGEDIYFGVGKQPGKDAITAHELAHVVQQTGGVPLQTKKREEKPGLSHGPEPSIQPICAARAADTGTSAMALEDRRRAMDPKSVSAVQRIKTHGHPEHLLLQRQVETVETQYPSDLAMAPPLRGFKPPADTLFELLDFSGKHLWMERLNYQGKGVLAEMESLLKLELDWSTDVDIVRKHHFKGGAAVKQVEAAAKTIGTRAHGEKGKSYREDVEGYIDAIRAADKQMREIGSMRGALDTAVSEMHTVALGGEKLKGQRDVTKKQEDFDAEQKRINDQKAQIAKFTGFAVSLVRPDNWMSMIVAATVCVGEAVLEENVPAGSIERLRQQLIEAKARLVEIEDEEQLSRMVTAAQKINAASQNLSIAKQNFLDFFKNIEVKQTTIVETLGRSSATKRAAGAIAERGKVAAAAIRGEQRINKYLAESASLLSPLSPLADRFRAVLNVYLNSPFVEGLPRNLSPDYISHLGEVSKHNADTLDEYKRYIEQNRVEAEKSREYLVAGEYIAGYSDIKGALETALIERNAPKQRSD